MTSKADNFIFDRSRVEFYSDIETGFRKNPRTGLLGRVVNENSIAQSLRNLMLTHKGERFYDADKGSDVVDSLFENIDDVGEQEFMRARVKSYLERYEPRVELLGVEAFAADDNTAEVRLVYKETRQEGEPLELTLSVKRVR